MSMACGSCEFSVTVSVMRSRYSFFFSSRRRHTRWPRDWSSDVCSSDLLSGGQQQRVALARALVIQPSVLLLDEPLSNLDAKLREETRAQIRLIQKRAGTTSVYVTHDQSEAMAMSDRIEIGRAAWREGIDV